MTTMASPREKRKVGQDVNWNLERPRDTMTEEPISQTADNTIQSDTQFDDPTHQANIRRSSQIAQPDDRYFLFD